MEFVIQKCASPQSKLDTFLAYSPSLDELPDLSLQTVLSQPFQRKELVNELNHYNQLIGNDEKAFQNIEKLKNSQSFCVATGQQLGFMSGPAYTIWKGISCLLLAQKTGSIPLFWLATEDHDLHEIDHTYLLDPLGNLEEFKLAYPERKHLSIEDLLLTEHHQEMIQSFLDKTKLAFSHFTSSYATTMAAFMAWLFRGTGLVFVEPKGLRKLAKPFFQKILENYEELFLKLCDTTKQLIDKGGKALLPTNEVSHLFLKSEKGRREKLVLEKGIFHAEKTAYSLQDLLQILDRSPERFSPNAALRPVLQNYLLPVVAYCAGPSELKYYRQLKELYDSCNVSMPWIVPRILGTLITAQGVEVLKALKLKPSDPIPMHWIELMPDLKSSLDKLQEEWEVSALKAFPEEFSEKKLNHLLPHVLEKIEKIVLEKRLKKEKISSSALHYLRNLIHPHHKPQERVLNWCAFQSETKTNLIESCLKELKWDSSIRVYVNLN